jgi:hypothetical protein
MRQAGRCGGTGQEYLHLQQLFGQPPRYLNYRVGKLLRVDYEVDNMQRFSTTLKQ